ncbi:hypothetical protein DVH26_23455 [Paenibacillus sp. H1-7]|uniref:hypothetical protein n=1 Tax=Paenibacillus sp. H1-7 TaxID=2282849 RepID=UPI001EF941CE|nr:hypothetical protein [Paenibacillus sp. H1-7]ULL17137.1 hypothetical protein DVH26_23455 [Paenibacillus sp. H1-7]
MIHKPKLGIQGPVVAWQDPWDGDASDRIMRTGTGSIVPSQDSKPAPKAFLSMLRGLEADFYVHHMLPGGQGYSELITDIAEADMDICLGNEYGNINGPWVEGTNRYDVSDEDMLEAARSGRCIGLLYDEPEHLQINAGQYRKDGWFPHWGSTDGLDLQQSREAVERSVEERVRHVQNLLERSGYARNSMPLLSEHVFPTSYHTYARAGMDICPKIMKESFQSLQLSTALGAAKQYGRSMWICADLWGPDTGAWFTRFPGFPGHSPEEFASALRMGYLMGPSHLFVENVDVLMKHTSGGFVTTEFGDVWQEFVRRFIPEHPLHWHHSQAEADIVVIHSDDSNYGQNKWLFGNRTMDTADVTLSESVFAIWHLLSRGAIPAHGSCMHIPGYSFPRHELKRNVPLDRFPLEGGYTGGERQPVHPLFYPVHNVVAYDHHVTAEQLGKPKLTLVGGSSLSAETLKAVTKRAENGGVVVIGEWLIPDDGPADWKKSGPMGFGRWIVTGDFLDSRVKEEVEPYLGEENCWMQRFGTTEIRMTPNGSGGFALDFEIHSLHR